MTDLVFRGQNDQVVTTSLKVAEVFEKEHQHILRDIRSLIEGMSDFGETPMFEETTYIHEQNGQTYPMFLMNRDGFTLLAMGFTGKKALQFKMAYIKAFNQMEQTIKAQFRVPTTFAEALRLAAEQQEKFEEQTRLIEAQRPKVEFFDAVADSKDAVPMNDVAKVLDIKGMGRNNLFEFLRNKKILMLNNRPYQQFIDRGYFRVIEQHYMKNGEECINFKTLVYQKGVDFIRKMVAKR